MAMGLLEPAVGGVDKDPIGEIVEGVRITLTQPKGFITFGEIVSIKGQNELIRVGIHSQQRSRCAGNHPMGMAIDHALKRLGIALQALNCRFWKHLFCSGAIYGPPVTGNNNT